MVSASRLHSVAVSVCRVGVLHLLMYLNAAAADVAVLKVDADGVQRGNIDLDSYAYRPNHLTVQAQRPVELKLHNVSILAPHNFIIEAPAQNFHLQQDLSAGTAVTIRFTPPAGTYTFYCDKQLLFFKSHREQGMEGTLEVR